MNIKGQRDEGITKSRRRSLQLGGEKSLVLAGRVDAVDPSSADGAASSNLPWPFATIGQGGECDRVVAVDPAAAPNLPSPVAVIGERSRLNLSSPVAVIGGRKEKQVRYGEKISTGGGGG